MKNIRCPRRHSYRANLGHYHEWAHGVQEYVDRLLVRDPFRDACVLHVIQALWSLIFIAVFLKEGFTSIPQTRNISGKLRLLYERAPLAFVVEQAGGSASTGVASILDVRAASIHQRAPLAIGSPDEVAEYERFSTNLNATGTSQRESFV